MRGGLEEEDLVDELADGAGCGVPELIEVFPGGRCVSFRFAVVGTEDTYFIAVIIGGGPIRENKHKHNMNMQSDPTEQSSTYRKATP